MSAVFEGASVPVQLHLAAISPQELAQKIKAFISGMDPVKGHKLPLKDHARCAVLLLRTVPACRGAVLEHLCSVFDEYVGGYVLDLDCDLGAGGRGGGTGSGNLDDIVQEIHAVLSEFVRLNPKAWAPLVSGWSIDLMGCLSTKYSSRQGVPHAGSLNELLQFWMSCKASRALMELYSQCLTAMISSCPDACVDALLDTSVQHSPHFDWVVAHIGSSFPNTIISRVLSCGLKDFCAHGGGGGGAVDGSPPPQPFPDTRVPKIASVVGILGHLACRHADSIKQELLGMFQESLGAGPGGDPQQRAATVPFLLQLAVMSPALLGAVSSELVDSLKPPVLNQLQQLLGPLPREERENMISLAVHLLGQTSSGSFRLLRFLVDTAMPASVIIAAPGLAIHEGAREASERVVQLLLLSLQNLVFSLGGEPPGEARPPIPFLDGLRPHVRELCVETLRLERKRHLWLHQLLALLAVHGGPSCATEALCHMFTLARTQEELGLAAQLHAAVLVSSSSCVVAGLLPATLQRCVAQIHAGGLPDQPLAQLLSNLALMAQWDQQSNSNATKEDGSVGSASSIMSAQVAQIVSSSHLHDFSPLLLHDSPLVSEAAASLLSSVRLPGALQPARLLSVARAAVAHFFLSLRGRAGAADSARLLTRLSSVSSLSLKAVLQLLVEGALLWGGNAEMFGGKREPLSGAATPAGAPPEGACLGDARAPLLEVNLKFGSAVSFSSSGGGSVGSVFHAGVVGRGLKPRPPLAPAAPSPQPEETLLNQHLFLDVLTRCCCSSTSGKYHASPSGGPEEPQAAPVNPEAAKLVAAALAESVCPDVANGELPWPPEDHARTTVERDIRVRRRFQENPLLFQLLWLVAAGRPALCYCSVVLRSLLATLLAHWEGSREATALASPWHLRASSALVACMGEAQLLPPALGNMHEVFPFLAPFEVRLLLLSVWDYMRENSPLPQRFSFSAETGLFYRDFARDGDVSKYLSVLYSVLHKNVDRLGHLCGRFQL
ncbi:integrator complex subunit 5 [Polyodon spathula]|uniref:integrator complex subunit 5 n=1 Tax=Polyodon spathula TaxID=7913 RepID=UPI001B7DC71A|nr:integrator complex subunit 5 [Polyodon spathula]